jgi:hypothetical protein
MTKTTPNYEKYDPENLTPELKKHENEFSQMCPGPIWEGPGSFRSSKTMFLNGFQLGNFTNSDIMKLDQVGIEIDPGRRQQRRKQCAFKFQYVLSLCVVVRDEKNIFPDIDRWKGILSLSGHLSADTNGPNSKFLLMYIDIH